LRIAVLFAALLALVAGTTTPATKKPTPAPTIVPVYNATITNGLLTFPNQPAIKIDVGLFTSGIQGVINTYFPKMNFKTVTTINLKGKVWLNSTSLSLSYLTIQGKYSADVPLLLPSQFILVMDDAEINAIPSLFSHPANENILTQRGNGIVNIKGAHYSGVVSPGGPAKAKISCALYPVGSNDEHNQYKYPKVPSPAGTKQATGPDGLNAVGASHVLFDGIYVEKCGMSAGNFNFFNVKVAEIVNCVSEGGGVRGIWVIITSNIAIHYNLVTTSAKFGIDYDASAGPFIMTHSNTLKHNTYQAVFIEQGAEFSVSSNNVLGPHNQNGVSFFNNIYPELVNDHLVLSNQIFGSTAAGLNVGSISCTDITLPTAKVFCPIVVGYWPTSDSYIIGNDIWGNKKAGTASNGNAQGMYFSHNNDTQGFGAALFKGAAGQFTGIAPDPYRRLKLWGGDLGNTKVNNQNLVTKPVSFAGPIYPCGNLNLGQPSCTLSMFVNYTVNSQAQTVFRKDSFDPSGRDVTPDMRGLSAPNNVNTCSTIKNIFQDINQRTLQAPPTLWQWRETAVNNINFVEVTGDLSCDVGITLPDQTYLVLNGKVTPTNNLNLGGQSALIAGSNSHYSGVLDGNPGVGIIDCGGTQNAPKQFAAISVFASQNFLIEGMTIQNCGFSATVGAITVQGGQGVNTTEITGNLIQNNGGPGIVIQRGSRIIAYQNVITGNNIGGIALISGSERTIIHDNLISNNNGNGISVNSGSTQVTIEGNVIQGNAANGVSIFNIGTPVASAVRINGTSYAVGTSADNIIMRNMIINNQNASINLFAQDGLTIEYTKIIGNTIMFNKRGLTIGGVAGSVKQTIYFTNNDLDGLTDSFMRDDRHGKVMDPMSRAKYNTPIETALSFSGKTKVYQPVQSSRRLQAELPQSSWDQATQTEFESIVASSLNMGLDGSNVQMVSCNDTQTSSSSLTTTVDWVVSLHLEDTLHSNATLALAALEQTMLSSVSGGGFLSSMKNANSPILRRATGVAHITKSKTSYKEHKAPTVVKPKLTKVKKTPVKTISPIVTKPVAKPSKKPGKKGKEKGGKLMEVTEIFFSFFAEILSFFTRLF